MKAKTRVEAKRSAIQADEFDRAFDAGESVIAQLDVTRARRPGLAQRRVNVDFPEWMIAALDQEADRIGVTRQSIIKVWIAERLAAAHEQA